MLYVENIYTVCFTGPRPVKLFGYKDKTKYYPIYTALTKIIKALYNKGVRKFISGGAQGFDQIAFWTVDTIKQIHPDIQNIVYIPYEHQMEKWLKYGMFGQEEYKQMLQKADLVINVSETLLPNINTTTRYGSIKALMTRNEAMVNDSNFVIGLYSHNTDFQSDNGGTAACLRYAFHKKPILMLDPNTLQAKYIEK